MDRAPPASRWKTVTRLILCSSLAVAGASRVAAQEAPSPEQECEKQIEAITAQMREAEKERQEIAQRLRELGKELQAPQRKRPVEDIRREHESLVKQMREVLLRIQRANQRHNEAMLDRMRKREERASGLRAVPPENRIRADFGAWREQGQALARAFCARHPALRYTRPGVDEGFRGFRGGHLDLLGWTNDYRDHFGGREKQEFDAAFPQAPKSVTVGYWPLAVAVHPGNPITRLTLDQLRKLASERKATWKDLGRPTDGLVRLHLCTYQVAAILIGDKGGGALSHHRARHQRRDSMSQFLKGIADDPDALLMWHHTERIAASGLKVLPIVDSGGRDVLPSDLPAVASGRYVLRTPLTFIVHPRASAAGRRFARWLTTEEAAQAIAAYRSGSHPADVPLLAHVTLAAKDAPAKRGTAGKTPPPKDGASAGSADASSAAGRTMKIDGAVAVMPTEPLSRYFLMAGPSHQDAYEHAVTEAIRVDGRLKLIDRARLARLLEEHKLEILQSREARPRAIVAADVFVFSCIATDGAKSFLQVSAIHGPTAGTLGELKLPIDPADPGRFQPPLAQTLAAWWPRVLGRLDEVRHKPLWTLVDVYTGSVELEEMAGAVRGAIDGGLASDPRVFFSRSVPMGQTQEEVLLRLMGLSRPEGGRQQPAADYLIEARVAAADRIELRLRGANLAVLERAELVEPNRAKLLARVKTWLAGQVARHGSKLAGSPGVPAWDKDDWATSQARLEYEAGVQWSKKAGQRQADYDRALQELFRQGAALVRGEEHAPLVRARRDIERYRQQAWRHYRRAAQLDPTWEKAAWAEIASYGSDNWIYYENLRRGMSFAEPIDARQRFLKRFPRSDHARQVLADYTGACMNLAGKGKIPPGLDQRSTRLKYYRKGMEGCRRYIAEYTLRDKHASDWPKFMPSHYLYWLQKYVELADPPEAECRAIVSEWSESYDTHLDRVPHSDFVRLIVLARKKDRPGFVALLTKMQQRWPDPKHPQWQHTADMVSRALHGLFYDHGGGDSFDRWRAGKRGIGDLPRPGYDPKEPRGALKSQGVTDDP